MSFQARAHTWSKAKQGPGPLPNGGQVGKEHLQEVGKFWEVSGPCTRAQGHVGGLAASKRIVCLAAMHVLLHLLYVGGPAGWEAGSGMLGLLPHT